MLPAESSFEIQMSRWYFKVFILLFSGSIIPEPCTPGTFQPLSSEGTCLSCTEGMYCNGIGVIEPVDCIAGHRCPEGR